MSVAGILSSAAFTLGAHFFQNRSHQIKQEFQQLGADLQSGNLPAAQADFTALQKLQPQPPTSSSSTQSTNAITQDMDRLTTDLKANDTTAAQKDLIQLRKDLQTEPPTLRQHHGCTSDATSLSQLFSQLGSALQSGSLAAAQKAYSALLQDFGQASDNSAASSLSAIF